MERASHFEENLESLDKILKGKFGKGTDIGFQTEEIKKTSTEDLIILRSSIVCYLQSKKLKKRNANYMIVLIRINKELKQRQNTSRTFTIHELRKNKELKTHEKISKNKILTTHKKAQSFQKLSNFIEEIKVENNANISLLGRKSSTDSQIEVNIPSFLNDKNSECMTKNQETNFNLKNFNFAFNSNNSEFGMDLFNERINLELSENNEAFNFTFNKAKNFEDDWIFQIHNEIKHAVFDTIPEDIFFCLD